MRIEPVRCCVLVQIVLSLGNVVINEPLPFRYGNVQKGEFRGSQIIQGWLNVDSSKVIKTDSELDKNQKIV